LPIGPLLKSHAISEDCFVIPSDLLGPEDLAAVLRPFGSSRMLPSAAYVSPDVFAWERTNFFAGTWTCVGRKPDRGQQAYAVGDLSVLVTVVDGVVRAFGNTCSHRGHELLPAGEADDRPALVCPYHGWTYRLDGSLRTAPYMGRDFDKSAWGLRPLPVVDWHGWLFVNASGAAPPFQEHIGDLERHVAPYFTGPLHLNATRRYDIAANWKLVAENYHECYHCASIHPELCAVTVTTSGDNWDGPGAWVGGSMGLREHAETMSLSGRSGAGAVRLPGVDPRMVVYPGIFPNLLLALHPDYVLTYRLVPLAADRTVVECQWLFASPDVDPTYAIEFWDVTNKQDWAAVESVQRGLASRHHVPGPLAPNESAIYDWVTMLARGYRDLASIPRNVSYAGRVVVSDSA
jgi:glycine betaine catabolism A